MRGAASTRHGERWRRRRLTASTRSARRSASAPASRSFPKTATSSPRCSRWPTRGCTSASGPAGLAGRATPDDPKAPAGDWRRSAIEIGRAKAPRHTLLRFAPPLRTTAVRETTPRSVKHSLSGSNTRMSDLRYAIRMLRRSPSFTVVAIVTLSFGIGANSAMFSIVNSLLLRPLPVERPDRLVLLLSNASNPNVNIASPWSNPLWEEIRDHHADLFSSAFAFSRRVTRFNLAQGGPADAVDGIFASGAYFTALGVAPVRGRTFTP